MEREALYERIDERVDAMVAGGAADEVRAADAAGASPTARKALGFAELLAGDVEAMQPQHPPLRQAPAHVDAQAAASAHLIDVTDRDPADVAAELHGMIRGVRFEKWQALGNDYLIVEAASLSAPLTPERVRDLCDRTSAPGADGVLELSPPDEPGFVARLRIFNPDGSEAELSGNGAREAILYLRRARLDRAPTRSRSRPPPARSGRRSPGRRPAASTWAARS